MLRKDPFITGEYYHVYNRGVDKRVIFKSTRDYERFLMLLYISNSRLRNPLRLDDLLNKQKKTFKEVLVTDKGEPLVSIGAWCLMSNHFHILLRQEIDGGITKFMKKLGVGYAMFFNIKYQRTGALFGGLFKSKLINTNDNYMRHLFGYIHLNPLEIKFPDWQKNLDKNVSDKHNFLKSYPYSSYQEYLDMDRAEKTILNRKVFPSYFQDKSEFSEFIKNYLSTE